MFLETLITKKSIPNVLFVRNLISSCAIPLATALQSMEITGAGMVLLTIPVVTTTTLKLRCTFLHLSKYRVGWLGCPKGRVLWRLVPYAISWCIWKQASKLVLKGKWSPIEVVWRRIGQWLIILAKFVDVSWGCMLVSCKDWFLLVNDRPSWFLQIYRNH